MDYRNRGEAVREALLDIAEGADMVMVKPALAYLDVISDVKAAVDRYWQFYFFDAFRRGRNEISFLNRFFGRMGRIGEYLTYPWQFYSFYDAYEIGRAHV